MSRADVATPAKKLRSVEAMSLSRVPYSTFEVQHCFEKSGHTICDGEQWHCLRHAADPATCGDERFFSSLKTADDAPTQSAAVMCG
jgi:hypothetical protein